MNDYKNAYEYLKALRTEMSSGLNTPKMKSMHIQNSGSYDHSLMEKNKIIAELQDKLVAAEMEKNELNNRINELSEKLADKNHEVEPEVIDAHDKVRLELLLKLIEGDGGDLDKYGNKAKAATIMNMITKLPISTCKNYCSNQDMNPTVHQEEVLQVNSILQAIGMKIRL